MKISDVEYQADGKKATFYYTAEQRVDFRQLIKDMAQAFSIRIEMRQIGLRLEASRLGGIGSCGRELCCSTWLTDFRSVSSGAARYQQLSLNPQKLSGQCGRLKCCLNYELDAYRSEIKKFPRPEVKLHTEKGVGIFQKMDIFKGVLWYAYKNEWITWHKLSVAAVHEIIKKNKENKPVASLEDFVELSTSNEPILLDRGVGQDSLSRFDQLNKKNSFRRRKKKNNHNGPKKKV
jgi:cell fate regulator YaaT (PSP1 superfamily)